MKKQLLLSILLITSITSCSHNHLFDDGKLIVDEENYCEKMIFTCSKCGETKEEITHQHTFEESYIFDEENHFKKANCGHQLNGYIEEHTIDEKGMCDKCEYVNESIYSEYQKYNTVIDIDSKYDFISTLKTEDILEIQFIANNIANYSSDKDDILKSIDYIKNIKYYPIKKDNEISYTENIIDINIVCLNEVYSIQIPSTNHSILFGDVYYTSNFNESIYSDFDQGELINYRFSNQQIYVNNQVAGRVETKYYDKSIIIKPIDNGIYYDATDSLYIGKFKEKISILDSTHIIRNNKYYYEIVGTINLKDIYDQYYPTNNTATLTIIDCFENQPIAEVKFIQNTILKEMDIDLYQYINYNNKLQRFLYEDSTLTNKVENITMDQSKILYLGYHEFGEYIVSNFSSHTDNTLDYVVSKADNFYTTYTLFGGRNNKIENLTLITSYDELKELFSYLAEDTIINEEIFNECYILVKFRNVASGNHIDILYRNLQIQDSVLSIEYLLPLEYSGGFDQFFECYDLILIPKNECEGLKECNSFNVTKLTWSL